jgi:hypothetical protein
VAVALEDTGDAVPRSIAVRDTAVVTSTAVKRRWLVNELSSEFTVSSESLALVS